MPSRKKSAMDPNWDTDRVYWYFVVVHHHHDLTLKGRGLKARSSRKSFDPNSNSFSFCRRKAERRVKKRLRLNLSLLDSQHGRFAIGADLPEIDDRSYSSDMGGSFKGGVVSSRVAKQHHPSQRGSWPADTSEEGREYMGGIPVVAVRDSSDSTSQHSTVPTLPPIRAPLSPIKDVSRETSQTHIALPPIGPDSSLSEFSGSTSYLLDAMSAEPPMLNILPATPQQSVQTALTPSGDVTSDANATRGLYSRDHTGLPDLEEDEDEAGTADLEGDKSSRKQEDLSGSSIHSSDKNQGKTVTSEAAESVTYGANGSTVGTGTSVTAKSQVRPHWKSIGLRKGPGSQAESMKGSMIMAPDGEIISLGGSVTRGGANAHDVGNINDVMQHHRVEGTATDESGASDDEPDEWKSPKKFSLALKSEVNKKPYKRVAGSASSSSVSKESLGKLSLTGRYILLDQATRVSGDSGSQKSAITEKDIMDTLTDHAQRIAESVLSHPAAGTDLEADVQLAAEMWAEQHPPRTLSRSHSVRENRAEAIGEIMRERRASSAAPSAAEYKALIKKSLATAAAKAAGIDPDSISDDAEISPELLEALASHKLTPDQIEIVSDSDGRTRIQSRVDLSEVMGVAEGHLYIAPGKKGEDSLGKRQISIPADKVSVMDDVEFDRISYQGTDIMSEKGDRPRGKSKAGSKAGSIAGGTMADLSEVEGIMAAIDSKVEDSPEQDDFLKAVQQATGAAGPPSEPKQPGSGKTTPSAVEQEVQPAAVTTLSSGENISPKLPDQGLVTDKRPDDARSTKSNKTGVSQKSEASKDSKKKGKKSPEEKEEPFVVGKPKEKKPKKEPLGPKKEDKKKGKGKKGKKGKKKEEEEPPPPPAPVEPEPEPVKEKSPPPEPTPRQPSPPISEPKETTPDLKTDESDLEFNFVREQSSPEMDQGPQTKIDIPSPPPDEDEKSEGDNGEEEDANLKSISNREARAAKRAAAAAKRREEVERRRREKEEQAKREKEEVERQIALQREMEEERRRREEERRLRKQMQKEAEERERKETEESERRQKLDAERERRAKEEYQRKLEEMKRKQHEEELRKHELMLQKQKEEEERRAEEELMMSQMAEQERLEYERKKKEEEEERKRKEMEEKLRRAEEARKAMEEAQRLAEEMAKKQAELEARLKFNRTLQDESSQLSHSQEINRAFVFSYFDLLQWLGLDIPEYDLAKLADY